MEFQRLAILGCGTLGEAILGGLLAADPSKRDRVVVTARKQARLDDLATRFGVRTTLSNAEAVDGADVVLVCPKPYSVVALIEELADGLAGRLLVSVCAGVSTAALSGAAPKAAVIRAMPNTPARVRCGMTVLSRGPGATDDHVAVARGLFEPVGRVRELDEQHLDVVTGLSGSGPAFGFVILEALADGGVMMGLPREAAFELAAQMLLGAAKLVLESGLHPAALKDQVTTPAGCTIAGLLTLEDGRIRSTLARAIQEATRVASDLGGVPDAPRHRQ